MLPWSWSKWVNRHAFSLAGILDETGSGPVLEPISKLVMEPVLKSIRGELG